MPASRNSSSARASAARLPPEGTGTWWQGIPNSLPTRSWSGWFEITRAASPSSSPLRRRQSRSSRQCSSREAIRATRFTRPAWAKRCSIPSGWATSPAKARWSPASLASGGGSKTSRMKNLPLLLECWSTSTMLQPAAARKPLTRAMSPGRSGQLKSRRVAAVVNAPSPPSRRAFPARLPAAPTRVEAEGMGQLMSLRPEPQDPHTQCPDLVLTAVGKRVGLAKEHLRLGIHHREVALQPTIVAGRRAECPQLPRGAVRELRVRDGELRDSESIGVLGQPPALLRGHERLDLLGDLVGAPVGVVADAIRFADELRSPELRLRCVALR